MYAAAVFLTVLVISLGYPFSAELDESWRAFKLKYDKVYSGISEELLRRAIFEKNLEIIERHNFEYGMGLHTYTLGVNRFIDMTTEEFARQYNGYRSPPKSFPRNYDYSLLRGGELPKSVDWRKKGYVTDVKDQQQCGSCWAFSATGAMEGQMFNKTGTLVSLSEQNLIDCSTKQGNQGCNGGWSEKAFQYVIDNAGLDNEQCYPYTAEQGVCNYLVSCNSADVIYYNNVPSMDERALQRAVVHVGPISVAIDANHESFQMYQDGVYDEPRCKSGPDDLDHAVLVVGYGEQDGVDYWLVKNSWSEDWGMNGYIWMSRNKDNQCGIATSASYPIS